VKVRRFFDSDIMFMSVDHDLHLPNLKGTILYKLLLEMGFKFSKINKVKAIMYREA
jgi:hypothetical protein